MYFRPTQPAKLVIRSRSSRTVTAALIVACFAAAVAIAAGALDAPIGRRIEIGIAAALLLGLIPSSWKALRDPEPTIAIGFEGIEGTFGLLPWSDVERIQVRHRFGRAPSVVNVVRFELKPGAQAPRAAEGSYASTLVTGKSRLRDGVLEIPAWGRKSAVLEDLQRFNPGQLV